MARISHLRAVDGMTRETLVMLPGMMCDARLFTPQIKALERNYDIVVPKLCAPASIQGLAQKVLDEIAVPQFNLLGLSMGGIVAMAMVGVAPHRVTRLALLDTNHHADAPERHPIRNQQIEAVGNGQLRSVIVNEMKPNYLAAKNRNNAELLALLVEMAMDLGANCFISQSIALRDRKNQSAALAQYPGPVMLLCGKEDELCPVSRHKEMLCHCSRGQLRMIADAGHIVSLERPDEVTLAVRDWLGIAR